MLEIIKKQEEIIAQYEISEEVINELSEMKKNSDTEMDILEYRLRKIR